MPRQYTDVNLVGVVKSIDTTSRDVMLDVAGTDVRVHFWTTINDTHGAWRSELIWNEMFNVDQTIAVHGHMGNNGRVILAPQMVYSVNAECKSLVFGVGKALADGEILTKTPGGKDVIMKTSGYDIAPFINKIVSIYGTVDENGVVRIESIQDCTRPDETYINFDSMNDGSLSES